MGLCETASKTPGDDGAAKQALEERENIGSEHEAAPPNKQQWSSGVSPWDPQLTLSVYPL